MHNTRHAQVEMEYVGADEEEGEAGELERVYVAITSRSAKPRTVMIRQAGGTLLSSLQRDCQAALAGLGGTPSPAAQARALQQGLKLRPLMKDFNAGSLDRLRAAQEAVQGVQTAMLKTLAKASERDGLMDDLLVKAVRLDKSAAAFSDSAGTMRRLACCRLYSVYLYVLLAVAVVVAVIVLVLKYQYNLF